MAYKKLKYWFDRDLAILLADRINQVYKKFDAHGFVEAVAAAVNEKELKARVDIIAVELRRFLPDDYTTALKILTSILGPENKKETGMFTEGYWIMPIALFVEKYGLDHFPQSMAAIREITKRNTGEYCIRPFLEQYPDDTMRMMVEWSKDNNVHVRRLASEGVRPRLPWARKLDQYITDPRPVLKLLENLKDDRSKFVQKSVANNLNDILKDNYEMALATIKNWLPGATKNRRWIIKHALRNQIKKGNRDVLRILDELD